MKPKERTSCSTLPDGGHGPENTTPRAINSYIPFLDGVFVFALYSFPSNTADSFEINRAHCLPRHVRNEAKRALTLAS